MTAKSKQTEVMPRPRLLGARLLAPRLCHGTHRFDEPSWTPPGQGRALVSTTLAETVARLRRKRHTLSHTDMQQQHLQRDRKLRVRNTKGRKKKALYSPSKQTTVCVAPPTQNGGEIDKPAARFFTAAMPSQVSPRPRCDWLTHPFPLAPSVHCRLTSRNFNSR